MQRVGLRLLTVGALLCACSDSDSDAPERTRDAPDVPVATANRDELSVMFEMEPQTVQAGTESMFCHYLEPLREELVVRGFSTHQGAGGHHLVIYRALEPKPAGTVEDCSTGESMASLMLVLTQTGTQEPGASAIMFPDKHVVVLPAGMQLVAQSHYINTTDAPQTTTDDLTVFQTKADRSTLTQLHLFVVSGVNFEIPPHTDAYSASAGCVLDKNMNLLSLVPHMHEWGTRIDLKVGQPGAMQPIMAVTDWTADMRDLPPITSFAGANAAAGRLGIGQSVQLTCTWRNTEDQPLKIPAEMCATVGYFTSADPDAADVMCLTDLPAG